MIPKGHQNHATIAPLFSGVMEDVHLLFRQEIALVRREAEASLREGVRVLSFFAISVVLAGIFLLSVLLAAAYFIAEQFLVPLWLPLLGIGLLSLCGSWACYVVATQRKKRSSLALGKHRPHIH